MATIATCMIFHTVQISFNAVPIQIPITNNYLGCGYKALVFCRNNGGIMENMDKGLTTKMGADCLAENTQLKCPKKFRSNLSPQAQKFEIFEKKVFLGVRSPW